MVRSWFSRFSRSSKDACPPLYDMHRLDRTLAAQIATFAVIGVGSTLAYAALYVLFRAGTGPAAANALALVLTAVANTLVNRRLTFGVRGRQGVAGDLTAGLVALALALLITSSAVAVLGAIDPDAGRLVEIVVLTAANVVATGARFLVLRAWIGGRGTMGRPGDLAAERIRS
jgi:putative flippase GtrA